MWFYVQTWVRSNQDLAKCARILMTRMLLRGNLSPVCTVNVDSKREYSNIIACQTLVVPSRVWDNSSAPPAIHSNRLHRVASPFVRCPLSTPRTLRYRPDETPVPSLPAAACIYCCARRSSGDAIDFESAAVVWFTGRIFPFLDRFYILYVQW